MIVVKANPLIKKLREEALRELTVNILPYWMNTMTDETHGGFYGRRNGNDELIEFSDKGVILNTRILWTFSHACRVLKNSPAHNQYLQTATRAFRYITDNFTDTENGGLYWMVNFQGKPVYTKKQVYAQAFGIYAFTEYFRATSDQRALDQAITLYRLLEEYSYDSVEGGYLEAFDRDWTLLEDLRLSDKDANERKTMNTHLHVLEAYTNLYACWKNVQLGQQLKKLILIFLDKIINKNNHLDLFFDECWTIKSSVISFGHDIEASWLLQEAAEVLEDQALIERTKDVALNLVHAVEREGMTEQGALINEIHGNGSRDTDIHWWPQAEALVGYINAWQISNNESYFDSVNKLWTFIKTHVVDAKGEWHWRLNQHNQVIRTEDKAGPWKCPYHNGRACMELMKRLEEK
jgi:mannobiose 2-epimerase